MDIWDAEGNAEILHSMAGGSPREPEGTAWLARRLLGPGCIRYRPFQRSPAMLCRVENRWLICLSHGIEPRDEPFLIGHELAEWFYRDHQSPRIEEACNLLGAALVAPRPAFLSVLRQIGPRLRRLADTFVSTQTLVALRIGETTHLPTAVVSTHKVWVRGESFEPFSEPAVRGLVKGFRTPGIKRTHLGDARHRIVLTSTL